MEDQELARRTYALPDRFADRLDPKDLANIREYASVGEWGEEVEELLACLQQGDRAITTAEREELQMLLEAMGKPSDHLDQLRVSGYSPR
jgi:hypothetical protein